MCRDIKLSLMFQGNISKAWILLDPIKVREKKQMYLPNWEKDRVVSQKETMYDAYVSDYTAGPCLCTYI